ncbi:MAG: hypothetical protein JOY69_02290 [Candidatus Eremiobacteraeota bacterium]|nr:hypothetical protein [Candidatus Eremiobacteraeota bacterium]
MNRTHRRFATAVSALVASTALLAAPARAEILIVIGDSMTVTSAPIADCNAKAKTALNSVLQSAGDNGSGVWLAYGPPDSSGHASASAAIHCFPLDNGYNVSFTCAVEVPPNPDTADALCKKLIAAFPAQKSAMLSPPTFGDRVTP